MDLRSERCCSSRGNDFCCGVLIVDKSDNGSRKQNRTKLWKRNI
jgi:hypothetical protein